MGILPTARGRHRFTSHRSLNAGKVRHTDSVGTKEYNRLLSRRRAQRVADYLKKNHSIDPSRVVKYWYGDADPNFSDKRKKNRFILLGAIYPN
jgi:hypothetical protein